MFLFQLQRLGYRPKVIITNGWDASLKAIAEVFPHAQHLLCRCHALQAAFRHLKAVLPDWSARRLWASQLCRLFHTSDRWTVRRRLEKLWQQTKGSPVAAVVAWLIDKLPQLLPAVGSTCRPTTSNAVEYFFAAFVRFSRLKGPFQNEASAQKHLALFMLGYVFRIRSAEATEAHQSRYPL